MNDRSAAAPPAIEFFRHVPAPPLGRFVEAIWGVRGAGSYDRSAVLPNGAIQLMLNFGAPHRVLAYGGRSVDQPFADAWIAGLQEAPLAIASPRVERAGPSQARISPEAHSAEGNPVNDVVAIRFRPGGAHAFLPVPASAYSGEVVVARDLLGYAAERLRDRLQCARTRAEQVRAVEAWLMARLRPREPAFALVERAIELLERRERRESVTGACERRGISNRHLIHVFRDVVGLPPKTYARIRRFHAALRSLAAAAGRAGLALDLGYADQAHFNHEFRRLSGITPTAFVTRRGEDDESIVLD